MADNRFSSSFCTLLGLCDGGQLHLLSEEEKSDFKSGGAIYIHPRCQHVDEYNRAELLKISEAGIPIVKCLAKDYGTCVKERMKKGGGGSKEYEFGMMPRKTYLARGSPVMLTSNFCPQWGPSLFNGAMGLVRDIYYESKRPSQDCKDHPDVIFVEFPSYCSDEIIKGHPKLLPIGPNLWGNLCRHECTRSQIPLRPCWAMTGHKSQGMTIGRDKDIELVILNLGAHDTDSWAPGSAFVQLSRSQEIGSIALDGSVDEERFATHGEGKRLVAEEDLRLLNMYRQMLAKEPWLEDNQ
eukprot:1153232-Rhodomonas_salina.2